MGILGMLRRDHRTTSTARQALKEARRGPRAESESAAADASGGALQRLVETFRDIGLDGKLSYSSAQDIARWAQRGRGRKRPEVAIRRIVRRHRRGVTVAGFLTGLGGIFTLPILLPTNVVEFYVQSTRMVGAIAVVRGYDVDDEDVRVRVLAALMGEESGDVLKNVGLGPVAGVATRTVAKRLPTSPQSAVAGAIGGRILRKFGLRSVRLFGKAIPGLGGVLGAIGDRAQLARIAKAARESFPPAA
ncbi:EcsC family protein [Brachybacterium sp. GCM10030267]|uniref:EcsC family protein n=1 Tax=Brachybacterium sp. GCM10030267 TaxID=3273381 RepID=UPI00361903DA